MENQALRGVSRVGGIGKRAELNRRDEGCPFASVDQANPNRIPVGDGDDLAPDALVKGHQDGEAGVAADEQTELGRAFLSVVVVVEEVDAHQVFSPRLQGLKGVAVPFPLGEKSQCLVNPGSYFVGKRLYLTPLHVLPVGSVADSRAVVDVVVSFWEAAVQADESCSNSCCQ